MQFINELSWSRICAQTSLPDKLTQQSSQERSPSNSAKVFSNSAITTALRPGDAQQCPQSESITRNSAFCISCTSIALSSGGKYKSVLQGMTIVRAVIDPSAAL